MNGARTLLWLILCTLSATVIARGHGHHHHQGAAARFDYYLMSLSWSPTYCETHPQDRDQCARKGFGFVLHGLWPQYRNGGGPHHCRTSVEPDRHTIEHALAFMPSPHLVRHEWQTHGACSGLDPAQYFALADRAFAAVRVPRSLQAPRSPPSLSAGDIVQAFIRANPGLRENMISVSCRDGHELREVRICLDKDSVAPRACGGRVRNTCRYGKLRIPATR